MSEFFNGNQIIKNFNKANEELERKMIEKYYELRDSNTEKGLLEYLKFLKKAEIYDTSVVDLLEHPSEKIRIETYNLITTQEYPSVPKKEELIAKVKRDSSNLVRLNFVKLLASGKSEIFSAKTLKEFFDDEDENVKNTALASYITFYSGTLNSFEEENENPEIKKIVEEYSKPSKLLKLINNPDVPTEFKQALFSNAFYENQFNLLSELIEFYKKIEDLKIRKYILKFAKNLYDGTENLVDFIDGIIDSISSEDEANQILSLANFKTEKLIDLAFELLKTNNPQHLKTAAKFLYNFDYDSSVQNVIEILKNKVKEHENLTLAIEKIYIMIRYFDPFDENKLLDYLNSKTKDKINIALDVIYHKRKVEDYERDMYKLLLDKTTPLNIRIKILNYFEKAKVLPAPEKLFEEIYGNENENEKLKRKILKVIFKVHPEFYETLF